MVFVAVILAAGIGFGAYWYGRSTAKSPDATYPFNTLNTPASAPGISFKDSFLQILPSGNAAEKLGSTGNDFRIKYVATANVNPDTDIGCRGTIEPLFVQYFYTVRGGSSGYCYNAIAAPGDGLKIIGMELELYGAFPGMNLTYTTTDPSTQERTKISAQRFLPFENGVLLYTPVGEIRQRGRIVFLVPSSQKIFDVTFPGGTLRIDLGRKELVAGQ